MTIIKKKKQIPYNVNETDIKIHFLLQNAQHAYLEITLIKT